MYLSFVLSLSATKHIMRCESRLGNGLMTGEDDAVVGGTFGSLGPVLSGL